MCSSGENWLLLRDYRQKICGIGVRMPPCSQAAEEMWLAADLFIEVRNCFELFSENTFT
jgi:hypothetical protein